MDEPGETSELFKVTDVRGQLAPVQEVLLPPEEIRRQKIRRVVILVSAAILTAATAWTVYYFVHASAVESTALAAGDTGRASDVDEALSTLGGSEMPGLRARLEAIRAFEGLAPLDGARSALEAVPVDDEEQASERLKAETYVALTAGDVQAALAASSRLIARGTFAAETAHARSVAALAAGDPSSALAEAQAATGVRADAPRYVAQLALAFASAGDVDGATNALGDRSGPALDVARARVLALARRDGGVAAAEAVLAATDATPVERAWAELVRGLEAARAGRRSDARERLEAALETPPPGDATFRWTAALAWLELGDADAAREVLAEVTSPSADPSLAGRVRARLLLHGGDATGALRELTTVPASPDALLLVARAHEARQEWDEARTAYDQAAAAAGWAAEALAGRADLELRRERAEEAATYARRALQADPLHPERVRSVARALIAAGSAEEALSAADAALASHAGDDRLLEAKGDALFALERWAPAVEALRAAAEARPTEAALQARRGEAARRAGERDEARTALDAALAQDATHAQALAQRFLLAVDEADLDRAATLRDTLHEADVDFDAELYLAQARFHVGYGSGLAGTRDVMRAMRERELRNDAGLRLALAELYLNAELWRPALGMFEQARRLGADKVEVAIGKALASVLDGRGNVATQALQDALEASLPEGAEEGTEPPAASDPRLLLARGRLELNLGRLPNAQRYGERALAAREGYSEAQLLLAEVAMRSRRDPNDLLRAAIRYPGAQPPAFAILAERLGPTPEGCRFARRYLDAVGRNGARVDAMESLLERCGE
ncbi:MAG: tetratricopeptide repeat protein [Sandaracinus sp.]|nr:tetratricopeptide repeat protein [Sandaracinus sp.]